MDKLKYKPRIIDKAIETYLNAFGAVCVEGPKWCGKTWSSSFHSKSEIFIGNPEGNFQNRTLAETEPSLVLTGEKPRLIDEWQEVPALWDAVRFKIDETGNKGQFILTGSSTPSYKGVLHSGAGRIARIRMRPMSLFESGDSTGDVSLEALCNGKIKPKMTGEVELNRLADLIIRGGWPENIYLPIEQAMLLPVEYIKAIIESDANRVDDIKRDIKKMKLLLKSLARNESTTASNRTLKNDIKNIDDEDIDVETVASYLNVFQRLFILDNQDPFSPNVRSSIRVKQSEKRHFTDPSIACAILGLTPQMLIEDNKTMGLMFEALCERDLKIYAESFGGKVFHYQDYANNEIDAVVSLPNGKWCAFEIKLGANKIDEASQKLIDIKNKLLKDDKPNPPMAMVVVCGKSNAIYQRPDGVLVIPITALKN